MAVSARIAVVGDVHDYWYLEEDTKALQLLQPNVVLLKGDFGEENVELVQSVANLKFPKAVILGNHDAWKKDAVQLQLESLSMFGVSSKLSVVRGRPFSCGGQKEFRKELLSTRYGLGDMDGSAKKICVGSSLDDRCGKDWVYEGGDHGDPDLEQAISILKDSNKVSVPLLVFGHMHKGLAHGNGLPKMIVVGSDDTIYLNGAVVPRVRTLIDEQAKEGTSSSYTKHEAFANLSLQESEGTMRAFTVVDILDGRVGKIAESWVSVVGDKVALEEEHVLFKRGN